METSQYVIIDAAPASAITAIYQRDAVILHSE